MPSRQEIELKFEVASAEEGEEILWAAAAAMGIRLDPPVTRVLLSRYIDGEAGSLAKAGAGFRARGNPDSASAIWTMKLAESQVGSRFSATEYELAGSWCEIPPEFAAAIAGIGELVEIARLSNRRATFDGKLGSSRVEAVVDSVSVEYPRVSTFAEIEFESTDGELLSGIAGAIAELGRKITPSRGHKLSRAIGDPVPVDPGAVRILLDALEQGFAGGSAGTIRSPWCR